MGVSETVQRDRLHPRPANDVADGPSVVPRIDDATACAGEHQALILVGRP